MFFLASFVYNCFSAPSLYDIHIYFCCKKEKYEKEVVERLRYVPSSSLFRINRRGDNFFFFFINEMSRGSQIWVCDSRNLYTFQAQSGVKEKRQALSPLLRLITYFCPLTSYDISFLSIINIQFLLCRFLGRHSFILLSLSLLIHASDSTNRCRRSESLVPDADNF